MKKYVALALCIAFSFPYSLSVFATPLNINLPIKHTESKKENSFIINGITYSITQSPKETLKGYVSIISGKNFKEKELVIPQNVVYQGKNYYVDNIEPSAFYQNNFIEKVTIPNTIKNIGSHAFTDCQNLKEIKVIPGANKYATINGVLFNVNKDTLITYPAGKLDKTYNMPFDVKKIQEGAFYNNKNLEHFVTNSSLEEIGPYAFYKTKKLKEVSGIVKLKTLGDYAFANSSIENISLSTYLEKMGKATFYKSNIKKIEIPYRIKSLPEYSFYGAKNLKTVIFKDTLSNIERFAFTDSGIESFSAPENLLSIDFQAFANCKNLKNLTFNAKLQSIQDEAFLNCSSLTKLDFTRDLKNLGNNIFYGCNNIANVSSDKSSHFKTLDNILFTNDKTKLVYVPPKREIPYINIPQETTSIKGDALNIAYSIDTINVEEKNENFSSENGILYNKNKDVLIKFPPKKSLVNVNVPYSVKEIKPFAFANAENLYGFIKLEKNVEKIGNNAFDNTPKIDGFSVDNTNNNYSSYNNILFNKDQTVLIKYPTGKSLNSFTIPDKTKTIEERAFQQANISNLTIGVNVENIKNQAFLNSSVSNITIKEGVTNIGNEAFKGTNIQNVVLPSTLKNIGDLAFAYCNNLKNVQFNALQNESFGYNMFIGSNNLQKIVVPINSYNNYKSYLLDSNVGNWQNLLQEYKPPVQQNNNKK
ncbi:leucine-rich repeat domain-containing protein [uncultured Tyzzerella sp.]|uniref:leucine-rich repeat domain-containing protein n=1 Tax=uncultured Tyzzerella sp. TaxID=2321398 RepID=UPI002942B393|nr:leucine-rich repeat domain-containing protein [uncultured Tyzzerella sp.]